MAGTIIRRRKGAIRPSTERANRIRFVVFAALGGDAMAQGSYRCPHTAQAAARELRHAEKVRAWVRTVG